uniref:Stonustoxin subunit alpha-like n=1 Tax=Salarias fasciatus TaxID=181472 RepID=A0A672G0F5_SALFA
MSSDILQVAALGQSFTLGMLYDARKDNLVSGFSLWDHQTVQENTVESLQSSSAFEISASDSTGSKSSLLDVEASVKASFLGGLIEVGGSAKYLTDQKKFMNQSRVTFQYKATTHFKQLTLTHLSADQSLIERSSATHVVTGILYGANAFFVFDSQKVDSSHVQELSGSMQAVIKKIPTFNVEGQAQIQLTDEEKALVQKFSCKFYGDLNLPSNPTTFEEAVKTYVELPKLLGENGEKTVPIKVWLMPLKNLTLKAPDLMTELSVGLVRRVEETLEDVKQMETRCNDALVDGAGEDFPQIQKDLHRYQKLCNYYTSDLRKTLEKKLPSIREGKEDESSLRQLFDSRDLSPFSHENLLKWLEGKEREINVIRSSVEIMEGVKIIHNQSELDREVLSPGIKQVLCFVFTSLESADPCLDAMDQYLDSRQFRRTNEVPWYYSDEVFARIRGKARMFSELATKFKNNKEFRFLVAVIKNDKHIGATIYQYKDAKMVTEDFSVKDVPLPRPVEKITDKEDLIWYTCDLTVDQDTMSNKLSLKRYKTHSIVTTVREQSYPDNPRRFTFLQFMCQEALRGRSYWEVEWSNQSREGVIIGLAYEQMSRHTLLGFTRDSFGLWQVFIPPTNPSSKFLAMHAGVHWEGPCPPGCKRVGIFLDWPAGSLSFYMVSANHLTHLHTFHTCFTDPIYLHWKRDEESNIYLFLHNTIEDIFN